MARSFSLEKRLIGILDGTTNRSDLKSRTVLFMAIGILGAVLPIAAVRVPIVEASQPPTVSANADEGQSPGIVSPPQITEYSIPPLYSDEARQRGIEGIVTLELRVDIHGRAKNLHVVNGLGFGLDENALLAVREWRFSPGRHGGRPVEMTTEVHVEFDLRNAEMNELIANDMATRVGPGVIPPLIIHRVDPQYREHPALLSSDPIVILDAVIQENGVPKVVRVVRSLAWELDETAIDALEQWRFSPAMKDGRPVKVRMNVEMSFDSKS
jgi:TonB family protein